MSERPAGEPLSDLLAAGLVHELRQPLTAAFAALRIADAARAGGGGSCEGLELMASQLARMQEILSTFQELLEPTGGPAAFDVGPVVSRAVRLFSPRVQPLGARFSHTPPPGPLNALGAPGALLHALGNLLANALDAVAASGDGRVAVRVLPPASPGAPVEVRVADEGPGVPASLRARIFDAGFSTRPGAGRGFGLAVGRRMMTRHAGDLVLVPDDDPRRPEWARTELAAVLPAAGGRP